MPEGLKKQQHIVVESLVSSKIVAHGAIHDGGCVCYTGFFKRCYVGAIMYIRHNIEKFLFVMFLQHCDQTVKFTCGSKNIRRLRNVMYF